MSGKQNILDPNNLKNIGTLAGILTVVVVTFYVTGVIRNVKEIQRLNESEA